MRAQVMCSVPLMSSAGRDLAFSMAESDGGGGNSGGGTELEADDMIEELVSGQDPFPRTTQATGGRTEVREGCVDV